MKKEKIDKLYGMLSAEQQAKLTFKAILDNDLKKADEISSRVPRFNYYAADMAYINTLQRIFDVVGIWTSEYWKTKCKMMSAMGAMVGFESLPQTSG